MPKKIFIGFNNSAGYGSRLLKGFRKAGIAADLYIEGFHPFDFEDSSVKVIRNPKSRWMQRFYTRYLLLKCLFKYDAFIFVSIKTFIKDYKDLKVLRFFRKKTVMILIGCDVQQPELVKNAPNIAYSSCNECVQEYKDFVGCVPETKPLRTRKIEANVDYIMTDRALAHNLKREYIQTYQPINIEEFDNPEPEAVNKVPVILHAPSNPGYKGTKYFLSAVERLKEEFDFEYRLVKDVKIGELYEEIKKADLIVDQLIQGWFGLLPLEAMMFGKPVVCYMREDLMYDMPADCPVINANPDTIYNVLRKLLQAPGEWKQIGAAGRRYVEKYHDATKVAKFYEDLLLK
jgi:hypothetical protein